MIGIITRIATNVAGYEYGIISSGRNRYYFDSRSTYGSAMSDFYVDDCVEFVPTEAENGLAAQDVQLAEMSEGYITYFNNTKCYGKIDDRLFFHFSHVNNFDDFSVDTRRYVYSVSFCETVNPDKDNAPMAIGIHIHEEVDKALLSANQEESSEESSRDSTTNNFSIESPKLTANDVQLICELLRKEYNAGQTVSLANIGNYLKENGVSPSSYGFPKLQPFLLKLGSFVSVENRSEGTGTQSYATFAFETDGSIQEITVEEISDVPENLNENSGNHAIVQPTPSVPEKELIDYFSPGFSQYFDRDKAYQKFLKPNSGEDLILDKLSKVLRISRIGSHDLDQRNRYQFCVAGATSVLKQYIDGKHEFLIIFSHFDSTDWQSSTLKVEREVRKRHEIADRYPLVNFYILISNARRLRIEVDEKKGGSTSAIIPFSFDELLACEDNKQSLTTLLLSRFDEYYFENNMLGETTAIDDDNLLFGDRGKIADTIAYRCQNVSYSGIFGLRRSGKTSVLNAVFRRLDRKNIRYIKIQSADLETLDSWRTALFDIAKKIRECTLGIKLEDGETRSEYAKRLRLNSTEEDYAKRASQYFVEDVQLYCRNENSFVIALDEVEKITYNTAKAAAWKSAEAFCGFWGALRDCGCAIIICGVNATINEKNTVVVGDEISDNPMHGRIKNCANSIDTYLPSFTDEQTKYMINTLGSYSGIAFSNVYQEINRAFGGQPYPIRQFCSFVFEKVKPYRTIGCIYEVSKATVENLLAEFARSSEGNTLCDVILQHVRIYQEEYALLCNIAVYPERYRKMSLKEIQQIDHLVKYGLIEWDSLTNYISFRIHIIQGFISERMDKDPILMTNDERRHYVQDNVARCERKLKAYVKNYYTFTNTEADCRAYFTSYISLNESKGNYVRKSDPAIDPNTCLISDFFDHKKLVLYFSDLKHIIRKNWNTLGDLINRLGISREKFISSMDDLNAGRTDAMHYDAEDLTAYPEKWEIDDQTIQSFQEALATMERIFSGCNM